ncbi:MAG: LamG domain-containing protein [Woeseiaceae bacterium]
MNNATGFATAPARKLRALLIAGVMGVVLSACGGGAQTVDTPIPNVVGSTTIIYNGTEAPQSPEVQAFLTNVWTPMQNTATCGNCHNETTQQTPMFARFDDINLAYSEAMTAADLVVPSNSLLVSKVRGQGGANGHNCWLGDANACGDIMTTWIEGWAGATAGGGGRQIVLTPPPLVDPGDSKNYADATPENFRDLVYTPYLEQYCSGCHNSSSALSQQPYFAESGAVDSYLTAYEAAKPRMDLDNPDNSQFVLRLSEGHNLVDWPNITAAQASIQVRDAIAAFAVTVPTTSIDPLLVNSKALKLIDGTIASGGNRYEDAQIGLWEFKSGVGSTAYDTSGTTPALDLQLSGEYEWFGGWGISIRSGDPLLGQSDGRAQGSTSDSQKLFNEIRATGEYSMEAWVVPANVTQEMARIMTYSGGETARNFTLQQTLYNYDFLHRSTTNSENGDSPQVSTPDAAEVLQATLQHVVATFSATEGRMIYVNGQLVTQPDPVGPGTMTDWDDTFAFVLGNEAGGNGLFEGTVRMAAVHKFALTPEQIQQNFDVGVGEKFFLLFSVEDIINHPTAYVLFEVAQFDTYSYVFTQPHFITLDGSVPSADIPLQGMRIGVNGTEVDKSQSYAKLNSMLSSDAAAYLDLGQPLSPLGAVIPLEKGTGTDGDEFFLTFDLLGTESFVRTGDPALVVTENDILPAAKRVGVRTFDEINATFAAVTGVDPEENNVDTTYQGLRQSFPAIEDPQAFLSSHQVAIAQLAFEYCNALMEDRGTISTAAMFPGFNFGAQPATAYANRDALITPLVDRIMGIAIQSQPDFTFVRDELGYVVENLGTGQPDNLIDRMIAANPDPLEPQADTRGIAKGACGAILGSAIALIQ